MAREFKLPDIGEGLTEAEVVRWLVPVGGRVEVDQAIVEVETDKAVVEIPSPYGGVVLSHGGAEGETIEVGQVLVVIGDAEEVSESPPPAAAPPAPETTEPGRADAQVATSGTRQPEEVAPAAAAPIVGSLVEDAEILTQSAGPAEIQVKALPIVRKMARDHGIDLTAVQGSGPGGRITREDVEAAIATGVAADVPAAVVPATVVSEPPVDTSQTPPPAEVIEEPPVVGPAPADTRRPMTRMRRTIAANMTRSWSEIPHVTTFDDVDATRLLEVRKALSDRHGVKIPVEALVIKAIIPALAAHPEFNATVDGDDLVLHATYDVGIAVDTPDGLMVAVVADAGSIGVLDLAAEVRRLGEGAKARNLTPDELTGQTFTVSNIGAVGGGHGTPIVPPGTTSILSVGRARSKPIVYEDDIAIAPMMPLSFSYDHRVIDGAMGRRFMAMIIENLEEPALFLAV